MNFLAYLFKLSLLSFLSLILLSRSALSKDRWLWAETYICIFYFRVFFAYQRRPVDMQRDKVDVYRLLTWMGYNAWRIYIILMLYLCLFFSFFLRPCTFLFLGLLLCLSVWLSFSPPISLLSSYPSPLLLSISISLTHYWSISFILSLSPFPLPTSISSLPLSYPFICPPPLPRPPHAT